MKINGIHRPLPHEDLQFHENLNIFIGPNNAGKSRFIRSIIHTHATCTTAHTTLNTTSQCGLKETQNLQTHQRTENLKKTILPYFSSTNKTLKSVIQKAFTNLSKPHINLSQINPNDPSLPSNITHHFGNYINYVKSTKNPITYIPTLRTMRKLLQHGEQVCRFDKTERQYHPIYLLESTSLHNRLTWRNYIWEPYNKMERPDDNLDEFTTREIEQIGNPEYVKEKLSSPLIRIFTGTEFHQSLRSKLLGTRHDRDQIREYQDYLGVHFFEGRQITLTPSDSFDTIMVNIEGEEEDRAIHNLGDGLQTLIIITYAAHIFGTGAYIIEEPDIFLHPGMQRRLLDRLLELDGRQYFVTTHSNHLIDMANTGNHKIFQVTRNPSIPEKHSHSPDDIPPPIACMDVVVKEVPAKRIDLVGLLGVRYSASLIVNAMLWVEGPTDRKFIQTYLRCYQQHLRECEDGEIEYIELYSNEALKLYQKHISHKNSSKPIEYREDTHFSFFEYAGSNITHYDFTPYGQPKTKNKEAKISVTPSTSSVMVIADADGTIGPKGDEKKQKRRAKLEELLGNRVFYLNVREIENTVSARILKKMLPNWKQGQKPSTQDLELLDNIKEEDYATRYLAEYLHEVVGEGFGDFIKPKMDESTHTKKYTGTFSGPERKNRFANKITPLIQSWGDMSKAARELTVRVYEFIDSEHRRGDKEFEPAQTSSFDADLVDIITTALSPPTPPDDTQVIEET